MTDSTARIFMERRDVQAALALQLSRWVDRQTYWYLADKWYCLPTLDEARAIIHPPEIQDENWRRKILPGVERADCDDLSLLLRADFVYASRVRSDPESGPRSAFCVGSVGIETRADGERFGAHLMNWMLNADGRLRLIEPSTGAVYDKVELDNGHMVVSAASDFTRWRESSDSGDLVSHDRGLLEQAVRTRIFQILG